MDDEIKLKKIKHPVRIVDDFVYPEPEGWWELVTAGVIALILLLTFPIWILPYLFGKAIKNLGRRELRNDVVYLCPDCNQKIIYDGNRWKRIECNVCGWSGYLDHIKKKIRVD